MQNVRLGKTDIMISPIIQGCWVMGKDYWGGAEDDDSIAVLRSAYERGINTIDTAYIYGKGHSERVVAKALSDVRKNCIYITKLWTTYMEKDQVQPALEQAMERLATDYIDVFFIHYPSETVPISDTMGELMRLKKEGRIRAIGVSNFSLEQMKEALEYGDIDVIQPCYSLLWRFIDEDILPFCAEHNIAVIPYSPLGQGILTGKMNPDYKFADGDARPGTPLFSPENYINALAVTDEVAAVASRYGRTPAQTAINWIIQTKGMTAPIVGARNVSQSHDNIGATGWTLSEEDYRYLDMVSKKFAYALPKYKSLFDKTIIV